MRYILLLVCLTSCFSYGQKKTVAASKKTEPITIDGKLDDWNWTESNLATDFVMFEPDNGVPIAPEKRTEIKLQYDNQALYIAAKLYDNEPSQIQKELTQRDNFGVSDRFSCYLSMFELLTY